jgi:uncharacterized protein YecE (DUF72 family)
MGKSNLAKIKLPDQKPDWDSWSYRIGCPVWGCKEWNDIVYPQGVSSDHILAWYSRMFPTVEGNSTFYAVPPVSTFEKWCDQSAEGFKFCFKFPQRISHDLKLIRCDSELKNWLDCLSILHREDRLGPTFLQLPPSFSFKYFGALELFLSKLPMDWPWAVEVRHLDWFDAGEYESRLDDLLSRLNIDRVLFDSRPLNSMAAKDLSEVASQTKKPRSPFRTTTTGKSPFLRLIGRNDQSEVTPFWHGWADQIAEWIRQGFQPWIFTHAPDDRYAPSLVKALHREVSQRIRSLPPLPDLIAPNNREDPPRQLELF